MPFVVAVTLTPAVCGRCSADDGAAARPARSETSVFGAVAAAGLYLKRPIADARTFAAPTCEPTTTLRCALRSSSALRQSMLPMVDVGKALADGRGQHDHLGCTGVENRVWDRIYYYYEINAWYPRRTS